MPALMVLGARLVLRQGVDQRELLLDEFYHDYQVNDLQPGEFVAAIRIPLPEDGVIVSSQKWSKRFDQDISAVCTAYRLELDGDKVTDFRMACGGMAATIRRATAARRGQRCGMERGDDRQSLRSAGGGLRANHDMRASADIRLVAVQNLLRRFWLETSGEADETVYTYGR